MTVQTWTAVVAVLAAVVAIVAVVLARRQATLATEQVKVAVDQATAAWDSARTAEKQADRAAHQVGAAEQRLAATRAELDERITAMRAELDERITATRAELDERITAALAEHRTQGRNGSDGATAEPAAHREVEPATVVAEIIADATAVVDTARLVLETTQPGRQFADGEVAWRRSAYQDAADRWGATVPQHITATLPMLPFGEDVVAFLGAHLEFDRSLNELLSVRKPSGDVREPLRARTGELLAAMEEPLHVVRESSAEWLARTAARYDPDAGLAELIMSATR